MGIDVALLRDLCDQTLEGTDFPELGERHVGKVRDSYVRGDRRTIIVSDRVSAFDGDAKRTHVGVEVDAKQAEQVGGPAMRGVERRVVDEVGDDRFTVLDDDS